MNERINLETKDWFTCIFLYSYLFTDFTNYIQYSVFTVISHIHFRSKFIFIIPRNFSISAEQKKIYTE